MNKLAEIICLFPHSKHLNWCLQLAWIANGGGSIEIAFTYPAIVVVAAAAAAAAAAIPALAF